LRPTRILASVVTCIALITACGSPPPTPTTAPPAAAATTAPATAAPTAPIATTAPTAAPAATKPAAAATGASAPTASGAGSPAAAATRPATGAGQTWKVAPDKTQVTLKVNERLADRPTNSDAVLNTKAISGQIVLSPDGKVQDGSRLTVDLNTLQSDSGMRDRFIKSNVLEVGKFPSAEFTPTELRGLPSPLPTSGEFKAQLVGTMKIRETTRPLTFDLTGRVDGNTVTGTATSQLKLTDFNMTLPRVPVLLSMEDLGRLEIAYTAST
jgi:polyisoprenoid-binding protein YceI